MQTVERFFLKTFRNNFRTTREKEIRQTRKREIRQTDKKKIIEGESVPPYNQKNKSVDIFISRHYNAISPYQIRVYLAKKNPFHWSFLVAGGWWVKSMK